MIVIFRKYSFFTCITVLFDVKYMSEIAIITKWQENIFKEDLYVL